MHKMHRSVVSDEYVRRQSKEYKKQLYKARTAYRKLYWKRLNGCGHEHCPISPEDFHEHFKRLSDWDIPTSFFLI